MITDSFTDKLGQEVGVGDCIIYGHALGRCAGLRIGKVLKIIKKTIDNDYLSPWRITVQGVDDDWDHNEPSLCRKGTLQFPKRIMRVDTNTLPDNIQELLRNIK